MRHLLEIRKGEDNNSKLSESQVVEIKNRLLQKEKHVYLSVKFGVSATTISKINRGVLWSHVNANKQQSDKNKNMEDISKVTIPLQEYLDMKDELSRLRIDVEKKTKYVRRKSTASDWVDVGLVLIMLMMLIKFL